MSRDHSYFNRLKPPKRKVELGKVRRPYVIPRKTEGVLAQPEPIVAFSAVGPSAEF